jgi:hypothetical protein
MSENHHNAPPGLASLVGGIFEDAQTVVGQEVALAQREVGQVWGKAKMGVALLASAVAVCNVVGVLLGLMFVRLLQEYLLPNHEWACLGIVAGFVALLGGALLYSGLKQIKQVHLSLPQTTETLREDAQAVSDAVSGGRASTHALVNR